MADFLDLAADISGASIRMLSFSTSARGIPLGFFGGGAFLAFFALGGVLDRPDASPASSSSSLIALDRFFGAAFVFGAVVAIFFTAVLTAAAFLGIALAF